MIQDEFAADESILGKVHLELAKYHEICRFTEDGTYDHEAALFHLKCAAECNCMAAIVALGKMYCGMPHDILTEVVPSENEDDRKKIGFRYMEMGAENEDRASMVYIARAFDTGLNLGKGMKKSMKEALRWYKLRYIEVRKIFWIFNHFALPSRYERIIEHDESEGDSSEWGMDDPPYMLIARQAEIWLEGASEEDLEKDPNFSGELYNKAAESAMASMKGKLANKYYMLAEESFAQVQEEEEEWREGGEIWVRLRNTLAWDW